MTASKAVSPVRVMVLADARRRPRRKPSREPVPHYARCSSRHSPEFPLQPPDRNLAVRSKLTVPDGVFVSLAASIARTFPVRGARPSRGALHVDLAGDGGGDEGGAAFFEQIYCMLRHGLIFV